MWKQGEDRPQVISYQLQGRGGRMPVYFWQGEVWLHPRQIAELYRLQPSTINEHLKRITATHDYPECEYVHKFPSAGNDGKVYVTAHYRLEVVEELGRRTRKSETYV